MDLALPDYDQAAEIEPTPLALARTCWARVALNRDLDRALSKCEASLALVPGAALQLSVRAAVYYRMGRYQEALRDCDQALSGDQNQTVAIMICGLSKRRVGDRASGDADVARAGAMNPAMAKAYARYGLSP
jgi:tetratricopeptide (TPR) repeat protein